MGKTACIALLGLSLAIPALAAEPPISMRRLRTETTVELDGRAVQTIMIEIAVSNDAAARTQAQQSLTYSDNMEMVVLAEGHTVKPDGRRLPVLPNAIRIQLAPGTPDLPQYTARKQVVAVFPDVAGGDVLAFTWRRTILHPPFPGKYTFSVTYARILPWNDVEVIVNVPKSVVLNTETFGPEHAEADTEDRHVHTWRWSAPAVVSDVAAVLPLDRLPRIFASTFADWPELSRIYAAMVEPKTEVTPSIQALADRLAAGAGDKQEEARRLYEWVSRHVRWVAIYIDNGAFVPHAAADTLAAGYGDCKDQVVLLMALLRARNIKAEPVLINLGPSYTLSGPATLTAFNHVITYLPQWGIYADTAAGGAPYGTLPFPEYGKPILHVTATGSAPTRMAVMPQDLASERLMTTMRLETDGRIVGDSATTATGPYATILRLMANSSMARGPEAAATEQLRSLNQPGTGKITPAPLDPIGPDYQMSASFVLDAQPGLLDGEAFPVPTGMRLLPRPGDVILGPLALRNLPATEATPCYSGHQEENLSLTLPPGYHPARLPRARKIENPAFTYESRWSMEDNTLRVVRTLASHIDQPLCEGPLRAAAAKALDEIRREHDTRLELEKDR